MAPRTHKKEAMQVATGVSNKKETAINKGTWTTEEDRKLAEVISVHGAKRWKSIAAKAGLNRCGKSCRLRWLNYLRPNIKRGNISDQEEDLILRLHKLLGNRWSLIAGRLPGRTDNEIKNYWNSHLSKKINQKEKQTGTSSREFYQAEKRKIANNNTDKALTREENTVSMDNGSCDQLDSDTCKNFNVDDFFDFSNEDPLKLGWMSQFLEMDEHFNGGS